MNQLPASEDGMPASADSVPSPKRFAPYMKTALEFLGSHQTFLSNLVLLALTYGGEEFFEKFAFSCPCTHEEAEKYAYTFALCPAAILLLLGILVRNETWLLWEGFYKRKDKTACGSICWRFGVILIKSFFLPIAWILVCIMDGDYYACLESDTPCDPETPNYQGFKKTSKVFFWWVSAGIVLIVCFVMFIAKCCKKRTYLHNQYWERLSDVEKQEMQDYMTQNARNLMEADTKVFLVANMLETADWDKLSLIDPTVVAKPIQELFKDAPEKLTEMKEELKKPKEERVTKLAFEETAKPKTPVPVSEETAVPVSRA